jgi:hypothetical protein
MPNYRYVGAAAVFVEVGDRQVPLAPGDYVEMSSEEFQTATANGLNLLEVKPSDAKAAEQKTEKQAETSEGGE